MIGKVARRREERLAAIVAAAWELARTHGVGAVSLHALAREVGMRQPSLYAYFDSKHALYDAMFADGNRQLLEAPRRARPAGRSPCRGEVVHAGVRRLRRRRAGAVCAAVPAPDPGFEPSAASYEHAQAVLSRASDLLDAAGLASPDDVDCFIAMVAGLVDAQMSNDPGGDRWTRHLDRLTDLYLDDAKRRRRHR